MKLQFDSNIKDKKDFAKLMPLDIQVDILFQALKNVLGEGVIKSRTVKFKLQKYIKSNDAYKKLYALNKIASDGKGIELVPTEADAAEVMEKTNDIIVECIAKTYIENKLQAEVEQALMEKQEKYIEEVKLSIIKKKKGAENAKTKKKLEELKKIG